MYCAIKGQDNMFTTDPHWQMFFNSILISKQINGFSSKLLPISYPLLKVTIERNDHCCAVGSIIKAYSCVNGTF